ncbi:MAG TPA: sulfite exporter TauE/SafE family protein, partial [Alcanivorax sp.]|nr:sulfite exporter TauE/SafE family protein [Alcanivorax sp.]
MIELMLPQLSAAALLAVAGAAHCVGMCGGIGTALTFTVPAARREGLRLWGWQLLFGVGRIGGYAALGAVAGGLGNGLLRVLPWQGPAWPALFSGALMLLLSIHFLTGGGLLRRLERTGAVVWRRLQPLVRRLLPVDRPAKALMLGALWGFLPCGLVYSALLLAASSASVVG